ncbi:MAG: hypothetical protein ACREV7_16640 [Steroidobacteraceae bacterium]
MSIVHPGGFPSHQHARELAGQRLGLGASARAKAAADAALADYQKSKQPLAAARAAEGRPEQVVAAREAVRSASTAGALDKAFAAASRSLRR